MLLSEMSKITRIKEMLMLNSERHTHIVQDSNFNNVVCPKCNRKTVDIHLQQGLKFVVSRYPRDTEIWFWILSLFYLYPDGIPHFFLNRDSS